MPGIAARPGSWSRAVRLAFIGPTPLSSGARRLPVTRSARSVLSDAESTGFQAAMRRGKDVSHRTLQPTTSTSTRGSARFPHSERLAARSMRVEDAVDAVPPASVWLLTLSWSGGPRERIRASRTRSTPPGGAALRRRYQPDAPLEAGPLTPCVALEALPAQAGEPVRPGPLSPRFRQEARLCAPVGLGRFHCPFHAGGSRSAVAALFPGPRRLSSTGAPRGPLARAA